MNSMKRNSAEDDILGAKDKSACLQQEIFLRIIIRIQIKSFLLL